MLADHRIKTSALEFALALLCHGHGVQKKTTEVILARKAETLVRWCELGQKDPSLWAAASEYLQREFQSELPKAASPPPRKTSRTRVILQVKVVQVLAQLKVADLPLIEVARSFPKKIRQEAEAAGLITTHQNDILSELQSPSRVTRVMLRFSPSPYTIDGRDPTKFMTVETISEALDLPTGHFLSQMINALLKLRNYRVL